MKKSDIKDIIILVISILLMLGIFLGIGAFLWKTIESDMADNLDQEAEWVRETEEGYKNNG